MGSFRCLSLPPNPIRITFERCPYPFRVVAALAAELALEGPLRTVVLNLAEDTHQTCMMPSPEHVLALLGRLLRPSKFILELWCIMPAYPELCSNDMCRARFRSADVFEAKRAVHESRNCLS